MLTPSPLRAVALALCGGEARCGLGPAVLHTELPLTPACPVCADSGSCAPALFSGKPLGDAGALVCNPQECEAGEPPGP